jgi:catechol 2,3-dioxygenase-like lactoylglutathione lyase family enzyme
MLASSEAHDRGVSTGCAGAAGTTRKDNAMDFRLELVIFPVTDVDRARDFYAKAGWDVDHDHTVSDEIRFVQVTPPGSACSIAFGKGLTDMAPGSVKGLQAVVDDIEAARRHLDDAGVSVSEVDDQPWGRFVYFADPDGNAWSIQQLVPQNA